MIIQILLWLPVIAVFVAADWYLIVKRKTSPDHLVGLLFRGMAAIIYGALVFDAQPGMMGVHVIGYEALSFWLLFEPSLNLARGNKWNYLGKEAASDRFFQKSTTIKIGKKPVVIKHIILYYILKLAALAICIVNVIYLVNYGGV